jgi:signal transduction histidine kinase
MREELDATFAERLEHEKLEALKELAYGASHEINNPLANIVARAQSLLADETDVERRRKLTAIHRQAMRAHEMIADLMLFARPPKLTLAACDVSVVIRRVLAEFSELASERSIAIVFECESSTTPFVDADATQLGVAIKALISNSMEAVGANGEIRVLVRRVTDNGKGTLEIVVRDDGPGISPRAREHLFDPFFSGREAGRGLGFGLSKCWRIVTDHGGRVEVANVPHGAEIAIRLPILASAAAA